MALKNLCYFIILTSTFCISITPTTSARVHSTYLRGRYGEFCNATSKCYKGAWLSCQNGICSCARHGEMIFDSQKQKCVSTAGERCRFELSSDSGLNEQTDCVGNAKCGSDGTCNCDELFYETSQGNCLPQKSYNQTCVSQESCRRDQLLECIGGICSCNTTLSEYSRNNGHCVGMAGQACLNEKCTANSKCVSDPLTRKQICSCFPEYDYFQNAEGHCELKRQIGVPCKIDTECKSKDVFLKCFDGFCNCDPRNSKYELTDYYEEELGRDQESEETPEETSYYDNDDYQNNRFERSISTRYQRAVAVTLKHRHECVGLAGSSCNPNNKCAKNSVCVNSKCECKLGYSRTLKGVCGLDYGSSCDKDRVCSDDFTCSEGKCVCKDRLHQIHSLKTLTTPSKCVGIVSAHCVENSDCIPNAICKLSEATGGPGTTGRCQCDKTGSLKFVENGEGDCELAHGSPCEYKSTTTAKTCDKLAQLECRNELCACPEESMVFDEERRQCFQLVGARCSETSPCVPSAICIRKRLGLSGVCECPDGTQQTLTGKCEDAMELVPPEEHLPKNSNVTTAENADENVELAKSFFAMKMYAENETDNMIQS